MKVLTVTDLFPTPENPERGIFIYYWAKNLSKRVGLSVYQIVWHLKDKGLKKFSSEEFIKTFDSGNVNFGWIQIHYKLNRFDRLWLRAFIFYRQLMKRFSEEIPSFDVVIGQMGCPGGFSAVKLSKKFKKPCLICLRGSDISSYLDRPVLKYLCKWAYTNCKKITVVSKDMKDRLIKGGYDSSKIDLIYNGVEDKFKIIDRQYAREKLKLNCKKIIIFVGNLIKVKGVDTLLSALSLLVKDKKFNTYIIGDGEELENLKIQASSLNLSEIVNFIGSRQNDELPLWYNSANLLCLPSRREGLPNVILESLACGTPVVCTDVGGNKEVIKEGINGLLTEPDDIHSLKDSISKALEWDWDRLAISNTVKEFTWEKNRDEYLRVIESLFDG